MFASVPNNRIIGIVAAGIASVSCLGVSADASELPGIDTTFGLGGSGISPPSPSPELLGLGGSGAIPSPTPGQFGLGGSGIGSPGSSPELLGLGGSGVAPPSPPPGLFGLGGSGVAPPSPELLGLGGSGAIPTPIPELLGLGGSGAIPSPSPRQFGLGGSGIGDQSPSPELLGLGGSGVAPPSPELLGLGGSGVSPPSPAPELLGLGGSGQPIFETPSSADRVAFVAASGSCELRTADADATLAIGRVDALSHEGNAVWVLGQKIQFGTNAQATLSIGDLVRVEGFPIGEGVAYATSVTRCASQYVAGATKVFLRSVVSAIDHSLGSATAGHVQLSIAAAESDTAITPFAVVSITGTQPAIGGVVLAETAF